MTPSFLLGRARLRFDGRSDRLIQDLSAVTFDSDGNLWVASDESRSIERLRPTGAEHFGDHRGFDLADFLTLPKRRQEVDIEGLDWDGGYLWVCGSHSTKRKKPKGSANPAKDLKRLAKVKHEKSRYLIARLPLIDGEPVASVAPARGPELTAAALKRTKKDNCLIRALSEDPHLGPFVENEIPSKENGLDIEGIAVRGDRIWLGLRGPVLVGWAFILELRVEETEPGVLTLAPIGDGGRRYRKHLVALDGLGIRDLTLVGDDLLILAGPTMDLTGSLRIYRLDHALEQDDDSLSSLDSGGLKRLIDLPFEPDGDKAEGIVVHRHLGEDPTVLVVYDEPHRDRIPYPHTVYADIFRLPLHTS